MRIFRDFQSNLPSIPVLILPEKFSKNIGGITQYLFTLFAIISLRFFEKKDGETWMRFRRKILEFFWCSTWLRSVIVNRSESEENCWVKREIPRIIFLKICLSILWERYWKTMRKFRDFQSNLPFNSVLILSEKFSKNIGGITQCLFTLFPIISVRFFEKRMVKLKWNFEENYSDFCRCSTWTKERILSLFPVFSLKMEDKM